MYKTSKLQRVGWRVGGVEGASASYTEAADSADLGSSSEYSSETLEDRSGKWFLVNSTWTRVSRP